MMASARRLPTQFTGRQHFVVSAALITVLASTALPRLQALGGRKVDLPDRKYDYSEPYRPAPVKDGEWFYGSATFYELSGNSGACGYPQDFINDIDYAATPNPRWSDSLSSITPAFSGAACGQCYEVKCVNEPRYANEVFCTNDPVVKVRITDADAHRDAPPGTPGGWPNNHFDLRPSAFAKIADPQAGIINIQWRRVPCDTGAEPKWTRMPGSNPWWHDIVVWDVPEAGNVVNVKVKPAGDNEWLDTKWGWGAHFWLVRYREIDATTRVVIDVDLSGRVSLEATYVHTN